jgi:hypothetical protein
MPNSRRPLAVLTVVALVSCGGGNTGPSGGPVCTTPTAVTLAVGEVRLVNPLAESSCLGLTGSEALREYLVVPYSGEGAEVANGIDGGFQLRTALGESPAALQRTEGSVLARSFGAPRSAELFHQSLRRREALLAAGPWPALSRLAPAASLRAPPTVGEQEQFNVCKTTECTTTSQITTTVRYAGSRGVIYLDDEMPAGAQALTQVDIDALGELFDEYLHPIDTAAFGSVSDIDSDQRIGIVITDQVNDLSPDCTNGRVVGYFFGGDLLFSYPGSNQREVFFAFAPKPATSTCPAVTRTTALRSLPPVLIHELQHMISFNQHVLRRGQPDEAIWLNEGLSHFAEELGQLLIPDDRCPLFSSCFAQFAQGNVENAYLFLENPEATYLVAPSDDGPTLGGRGAAWLFVRWLADHFAADTLKGTQLTRALLQGGSPGEGNVSSATGLPFERLVGEWLVSHWLDNLPEFPQTGRLRYRTWNLRALYAANYPANFPRLYPLIPDSTDGNYLRNGTLRAGTGRFLRVVVPAGTASVTVQLTDQSGDAQIGAHLTPRIAVVRIR